MQNNLQELFTLLSFLPPSHADAMREAAKQLVSSNTTEQTIAYTRHVLEPFILRRVKQDVLPELPPKTEVVQRVDMLPAQEAVYQSLIHKYDTQYRRASSSEAPFYDLVSLYMDLRKVANHPLLVRMFVCPSERQGRTTTIPESTRSPHCFATPTKSVFVRLNHSI